MIDEKFLDMTEERKKLILQVAGDFIYNFELIYALERLVRREEIYRWFIKNKKTGLEFYYFFHERRFSWLKVSKFVLSRIDKQKKILYAGKDVI